jgi:transposase
VSTPNIAPYLPFGRFRCARQDIGDNGWAVVHLVPDQRCSPICSGCQEPVRRVHSTYGRRVRDLNLGAHRVELELQQRRVRCERCQGTRSEAHEFVEVSARVTNRLSQYVAQLCRILSVSEVAEHLDLDWKLVKRCDKEALEREFPGTDTKGLRVLAIDEIAVKKGHQYLTIVLDYLTGRVVWLGEGRRFETLNAFFLLMSKEEKAAVEAVAMDMWDPFAKAVRHHLPNPRIVFDLFHVVASYHRDVLDVVRKAAYRKSKDEEERRYIKGSRFLLYKNEKNLTEEQRPELADLLRVNQDISTAYVLRDSLKAIWDAQDPWQARRALNTWCRLAKDSGIPALIRFAKRLRRHGRGIVAHARYPIHTSRLEGVNNKVKVIKRRSYGFHDVTYFALKVKQAFPGSACT